MSKDIIEIINDNVTFLEYYEKQRKEIERLKELDQEHQKLNGELRVENERLQSIIKEVREEVKIYEEQSNDGTTNELDNYVFVQRLKKVLDKGVN